ncbi:MAG: amino acid ABC transporter substrate-binding protein [Actinobacteria bacterium]|nr:MAG: amino acid ABC transporter substrate-binding protein [Actinomycetota bacterium]
MTRSKRALALILSAILIVGIAGCGGKDKQASLTPTIVPPVIAEDGVLRAGVDLSYPPFAGEDKGQKVGLDVDVAAALAERLGLSLELVDLKPSDIPGALQNKQIDVALGATSVTDAVLAGLTPAGSYISDGAGCFSIVTSGTVAPEITPTTLAGMKVGCQKESAAYWRLESDYGEGFATTFETVRAGFEALAAGEIDVLVADAVVGAYIARDFKDARFVGQYGQATALTVVVAPEAPELETAVREALDSLSSEGVLETIRTKWVGSLPVFDVSASEDGSATP